MGVGLSLVAMIRLTFVFRRLVIGIRTMIVVRIVTVIRIVIVSWLVIGIWLVVISRLVNWILGLSLGTSTAGSLGSRIARCRAGSSLVTSIWFLCVRFTSRSCCGAGTSSLFGFFGSRSPLFLLGPRHKFLQLFLTQIMRLAELWYLLLISRLSLLGLLLIGTFLLGRQLTPFALRLRILIFIIEISYSRTRIINRYTMLI